MHGTIGGEEDGVGIQFDAVMWKEAWLCCGDNRDVLPYLPRNSVDAIVTDPPYALNFMGKFWDNGDVACDPAFWAHCWRVLKPGGHLAAFGGSRSYHRMASAIEDAGFEIRDSLMWVYGSGFPKSHDVSKGIEKRRTEDIEPVRVICRYLRAAMDAKNLKSRDLTSHFGDCNARLIDHWAARDTDSQPSLPTNDQWAVLKTVLDLDDGMDAEVLRLNARKGEFGGDWHARKVTGAVDEWMDRTNYALTSRDGLRRDFAATDAAREWQGWGTALKPAFEPIVLARKPLSEGTVAANVLKWGTGALNIDGCRIEGEPWKAHDATGLGSVKFVSEGETPVVHKSPHDLGRWPANVCHDGSDEVVGMFPTTTSGKPGVMRKGTNDGACYGAESRLPGTPMTGFGDSGSAARFFYSAKANAKDRAGSKHPTVKPIALMQWLARLITPSGGTILDPFAGSGTTGVAALAEGMKCILIEREVEYQVDIRRRLDGDR